MSYSMMGGTGMGAAGTGMGAGPAMRQALSPQVMAMLQMMGHPAGGAAPVQPGGMQPMQPAPGPMQAPAGGTPMANMLGAPPGGMMPPHPPMAPPPGQPPGMQGAGQQMGGAAAQGGVSPQMLQMMQMLKQQGQGQSGVAPSGGQLNPAQNPNSTMPAGSPGWLQSLMGMIGQGGLPAGAGPAGGLT